MAKRYPRDSFLTLTAAGAVAAAIYAAAHQIAGHGGMCLAAGGELVRVYAEGFTCQRASPSGLLGPGLSLAVGLLSLVMMRSVPAWPAAWRIFLLLLAAFCLLGTAAQLAVESFYATGDWGFVGRSPYRWAGIVGGVFAYFLFMSWLSGGTDDLGHEAGPRTLSRLLTPYFAAVVWAIAAAAIWHGDRQSSVREALIAIAAAPLGYVLLALWSRRRLRPAEPGSRLKWSWTLASLGGLAAGAAALGHWM